MNYYRIVGGPLETNTYIVYEGDAGIIVDPGARLNCITAALTRLHITDVRFIIATHGHFDHVFYAGRLQEILNTKFYIHELDEEIAYGHKALAERLYGDSYETPKDVTHVQDGMRVELVEGFDALIIHTPGHTRGSVCLLVGKLLITGDTLFRGTVGRTDFPESSPDEMSSSLRKLARLPDGLTVLPGHGSTTTLEREKRTNPFMRRVL